LAFGTLRDISTADVEEICKLQDDVYRNRWITFAYWKISERLRKLIGDNASWCTFSTWSSRTIGENLRVDKAARKIDELVYDEQMSTSVRDHPWLLRLHYRVVTRDRGAVQLALALGNRLIFHEIAYAVIQLLVWVEQYPEADLAAWQMYRYREEGVHPHEASDLFPAAEAGARQLRMGLDCYFQAWEEQRKEPEQRDEKKQAELVFQGNILLGAYEQERADRMLKAALDPFPGRFVQEVSADPHGEVSVPANAKPWALRNDWPLLPEIAQQFGGLMTRWVMALEAPLFSWAIRPIRLGYGIPMPDTRTCLYPPVLETLDDPWLSDHDPSLSDLFDKYDRSAGTPEGCAARNWTQFDDRMNFIVNLFRAGQQDKNLYRPLPEADLKSLRLDLRDESLDQLRRHGDDDVKEWIIDTVMPGVEMTPRNYVAYLVAAHRRQELLDKDKLTPPLPPWADRAKLWQGQEFFRRFGLPIAAALFSASLPKSYTAERGAHVLTRTKDLSTGDRARRRIAETGQMLLDAMASKDASKPPLDPDTQAFEAARGVRLFHGAVRHMLLEEGWNEDALGTPINQEELLGTLAAFTVVIIESLDEMGVTCTVHERDAYFHLWLVLGDLLGIEYKLLFFEEPPPDEQPLTYADMQLLARVIFRRNARETPDGKQLMGALTYVSEESMPPRLKDRGVPAAMTRRLIGDEAANMVGVPRAGIVRWLIAALRPVNAVISPYFRSNFFGAYAGDLSRRLYIWWIEEGTGGEPAPWDVPEHWRSDAITRARRQAANAVEQMILVPRPLRSRMSGAIRPD
jgi:hypothetical protein